MTDVRTILEREMDRAGDPGYTFVDLSRRRVRKEWNRRVGVVTLALLVAAAGIGSALFALRGAAVVRPVSPPTPIPVSPMPIPELMNNGPLTVFGVLGGLDELSEDGRHVTHLMKCGESCTEIAQAAWSPDGSRIAFTVRCAGACGSAGDPYHGIRVLDLRAGTNRLIAAGDTYSAVAWSPDGTKIAYAVRPGEGLEGSPQFRPNVPGGKAFVMNADGTSPVALPGVTGLVESLSWSPDGTSILYSVWETQSMYLLRLGGFRPIALGFGRRPAWSPDGTRFAYEDGHCGLWVRRPDGSRSQIANLTPPAGGCELNSQAGPAWSPDGIELALALDGNVWVMEADGSHPHILRPGVGIEGIIWRPVP